MKLGYTIIYVPSVPLALEFYQAAFGLATRFCVPDNTYGELDLGGDGTTTLAFANESFIEQELGTHSFRANDKYKQPAGAQISLLVDVAAGERVDALFAKAVAAGATVVKSPAEKPWGQTVAYVRDLNGFLVELCTPVQA